MERILALIKVNVNYTFRLFYSSFMKVNRLVMLNYCCHGVYCKD